MKIKSIEIFKCTDWEKIPNVLEINFRREASVKVKCPA